MALSKSFQKGQTILACQMCEEESKIKWKCLLCNFLMCDKCRKIHQKVKSTEEHKIVDLKNIASEQKPSGQIHDFDNIRCDQHSGKVCCLFCTDCEEVVCPLCITNTHNTHNMVEISEGFKAAVRVLEEMISRTDQNLQTSATNFLQLQKIKIEKQSKYSEEKQEICNSESSLQNLIKEQSKKLLNELDARWTNLMRPIQVDENKVKAEEKDLQLQKKSLMEAQESNKSSDVFKTVKEQRNIHTEEMSLIEVTKYKRLPKFYPGHIEKQTIASIFGTFKEIPGSQVSKKPIFKLLNQYKTSFPMMLCIVQCPNKSLWITYFNSNEIQNISLLHDGSVKINQTIEVSEVASLQLSKSGDLLLSVHRKSNLLIFNATTTKLELSKYTVAPLITNSAFHISKNNKIILGAREDQLIFPPKGPRKVIVMNMEGETDKVYHLDSKKKPMFTCAIRITTDYDNNIYVVDKINEEEEGRLIKLNLSGGISNIYTGSPGINDADHPFMPGDIISTLDNIIVADTEHSTLHIINSSVQCIYIIKTDKELGVTYPLSLEFYNKGVLLIGNGTPDEESETEAKIFEVELSGI